MANALQAVDRKRAWRSEDFAGESDWITALEAETVEELTELAHQLPDQAQAWLSFAVTPLASSALRGLMASISAELGRGRGFALLRGMPAANPEILRRAFWVVGNLLGQPVMQNARGEVLSEVTDRFAGAPRGVDTRGYESNDELRFHCDGGDCIGMSCLRQAPSGATNGLVSLLAIYNEILAQHPEALPVLERGYALYSRKEQGDADSTRKLGKVQARPIPVFAEQDGHRSAWLNIKLAELAAEVSGDTLSAAEQAALQLVEEIAERDTFKLSFRQQPGDILWINNHSVMHRRDRYEDHPDPMRRRLLYRMWMNLHEAQPLIHEHAALRRGIRGPQPVVGADQRAAG